METGLRSASVFQRLETFDSPKIMKHSPSQMRFFPYVGRGDQSSHIIFYHLRGPYIGIRTSNLLLRVSALRGPEILAGLPQEGVTVVLAIRNRIWKRTADNEPLQAEAEALTLGRSIHLILMTFPTNGEALENSPALETLLRRLNANQYVEMKASGKVYRSRSWEWHEQFWRPIHKKVSASHQ